MSVLTRVAAPAAWLLDRSASLVFRLLGRADEPEERVTEGDVRAVIADAERTGGIEEAERRMITGVLRLWRPRARRCSARRIPACRWATARRTRWWVSCAHANFWPRCWTAGRPTC